jgi:hypothetical protein
VKPSYPVIGYLGYEHCQWNVSSNNGAVDYRSISYGGDSDGDGDNGGEQNFESLSSHNLWFKPYKAFGHAWQLHTGLLSAWQLLGFSFLLFYFSTFLLFCRDFLCMTVYD